MIFAVLINMNHISMKIINSESNSVLLYHQLQPRC